ncbi:MAG: molecular chaperone [Chitinophagaceae bacterium]|nr:MAG: molecular chaperone [Chitinophagaceae bacterium]
MTSRFSRFFISASLLLCTLVGKAQGDLLITPKRLVFDGTKRAEEINLANIGKDTTTYNISFVQYRMNENGVFIPVSEEDSTMKFASKNLRFFPRTVTLAPNEAQTVKVQLIRASELAPGEYRSHLSFKNVFNSAALGEEGKPASKDQGISVNIKPVFGISIATIIRVGESSVTGSLSQTKFVPGTASTDPYISFNLNRAGNISLYGDIHVQFVGADNKATEVALMKGLAVYLPNAYRTVQIPLKKIPGIDYASGKLLIDYTDPSAKNTSICKTEIVF